MYVCSKMLTLQHCMCGLEVCTCTGLRYVYYIYMFVVHSNRTACMYSLVQSCYYLLELHVQQEDTFDIVVPITSQGVQLLCSIVDNVEALVDEWFPGLRDLRVVSGAELIKPMSICPYCPCA